MMRRLDPAGDPGGVGLRCCGDRVQGARGRSWLWPDNRTGRRTFWKQRECDSARAPGAASNNGEELVKSTIHSARRSRSFDDQDQEVQRRKRHDWAAGARLRSIVPGG